MNFRTFLQEANYGSNVGIVKKRSIPIDWDKTFELLTTKCSDAFNVFKEHRAPPFWRGLEVTYQYLYVDPSVRYRPSKEGKDYYQIIMDLLPSWKNFPRRGYAVIGSTSIETAKFYGAFGAREKGVFGVFPFNGAKIGLSEESDIWDSFDRLGDLSEWQGDLNTLIVIFEPENYNVSPQEHFIGAMKNMDAAYKKLNSNEHFAYYLMAECSKRGISFPVVKFLEQYHGNFMEWLGYLFDPKASGCGVFNSPSELVPYQGSKHEVWTDSPCVLVNNAILPALH